MFLSYPTIASYSFAYVSQAIVSGDDNLRNGTAYNFCYNTHEIRYCDLKDDKFIFKFFLNPFYRTDKFDPFYFRPSSEVH